MTDKIDGTPKTGANLKNLKNQAKRLLKELKDGNPHALARMERAKLGDKAPEELSLADAQRAIARENGQGSWEELKALLESKPSESEVTGGDISIAGIDQIWLDCADLEATERFYKVILGLEKTGEVPGQMLFFDCGGVTLLCGLREDVRPNSILYLNCGDTEQSIQDAYNRLKAEGVSVGESPHCIARNWQGCDVWMAFFSDPSGNQLAFKCHVPVGNDK